jgi:hypothetical protein
MAHAAHRPGHRTAAFPSRWRSDSAMAVLHAVTEIVRSLLIAVADSAVGDGAAGTLGMVARSGSGYNGRRGKSPAWGSDPGMARCVYVSTPPASSVTVSAPIGSRRRTQAKKAL